MKSVINKNSIVIPKFSNELTLAFEIIADNDMHIYNIFNDQELNCIWIKLGNPNFANFVLNYIKANS